MTVAAGRSIDNLKDTERKIPTTVMSPAVLTSLEGHVSEQITGPNAVGAAPANVVVLSRPATAIAAIMSYVTATGAAGAVLFPLPATHAVFLGRNVDGVAQLTNPSIVDFTAETWVVFYQPEDEDVTVGGQTTVTP